MTQRKITRANVPIRIQLGSRLARMIKLDVMFLNPRRPQRQRRAQHFAQNKLASKR
jgi:hypothetical protein